MVLGRLGACAAHEALLHTGTKAQPSRGALLGGALRRASLLPRARGARLGGGVARAEARARAAQALGACAGRVGGEGGQGGAQQGRGGCRVGVRPRDGALGPAREQRQGVECSTRVRPGRRGGRARCGASGARGGLRFGASASEHTTDSPANLASAMRGRARRGDSPSPSRHNKSKVGERRGGPGAGLESGRRALMLQAE